MFYFTFMKATISHSESGKIQVFTKEALSGQGIKNTGVKSNGDIRYLLTEKAFEKIQHRCEWIG